jgi:hypothetical protein
MGPTPWCWRRKANRCSAVAATKLTKVKISNVESFELSKVSPMPTGLLDTSRQDEVLDLMPYVLSRGERKHEMFKQ